MTVKSEQVWAGLVQALGTAGGTAAMTGGTGALYVNGTVNAAAVTLGTVSPYSWIVTLPVLTAGQSVSMWIAGTIDSTWTASVVREDVADTSVASDLAATLGVAGAGLTAIPTIATVTNVGTVTGNVNGNVGGNLTGNVGGSVTGSVASVAGNVTGSVASVTGSVGGSVTGSVASVAGAVASVTGNVGGNVTGSIGGSVTGSVGSVAGDVTGSVASVTTKTGYILAATGLDAIGTAAPTGVATTFPEMIVQTWRRFFKKATMGSASLVTYDDAGTGTITAQVVSDDGTTQTQGAAT